MKKLFLLILLASSISHAEKMEIIPKFSENYNSQMFIDVDSTHTGKISGINRLNTTPNGQYVIMKFQIDCKARKFYYPKGQTITYDQHGNIVGTKIFNNVPVGKIKLSDQNVFTFLYKKYC